VLSITQEHACCENIRKTSLEKKLERHYLRAGGWEGGGLQGEGRGGGEAYQDHGMLNLSARMGLGEEMGWG
jgi:hypothetical protein